MQSEGYKDRQNFEMENWPELRESMNNIFKLIFPSREVSGELKQFVFTAASLASGCRHCQSHGSYHLHKIGVPDEKIQAMWTYQFDIWNALGPAQSKDLVILFDNKNIVKAYRYTTSNAKKP